MGPSKPMVKAMNPQTFRVYGMEANHHGTCLLLQEKEVSALRELLSTNGP